MSISRTLPALTLALCCASAPAAAMETTPGAPSATPSSTGSSPQPRAASAKTVRPVVVIVQQAPTEAPSARGGSAESQAAEPSQAAEEPQTGDGRTALDTRIFAAAMLGFASDSLNFGFGLRGGKTFENHLYVGGSFVYHVGESVSGGSTVATGYGTTANTTYSASTSAIIVGPEGGYDLDLKAVVLRPYLGLGLAAFTGSSSAGGVSVSTSGSQFVVWPGAQVIYSLPQSNFFLGGDAHVVTVPGTAFSVFATGGIHFST